MSDKTTALLSMCSTEHVQNNQSIVGRAELGLGDKRLRGGGKRGEKGGKGRGEEVRGGKGGKKGGKGKKKGKEGKKGRKMDFFGHVGLFICHCCGVAIF